MPLPLLLLLKIHAPRAKATTLLEFAAVRAAAVDDPAAWKGVASLEKPAAPPLAVVPLAFPRQAELLL